MRVLHSMTQNVHHPIMNKIEAGSTVMSMLPWEHNEKKADMMHFDLCSML
jgi:hypothetical protein